MIPPVDRIHFGDGWLGEYGRGNDVDVHGDGSCPSDLGAGTGALTLPLAATGATVWAVEADPTWAARLRREPSILPERLAPAFAERLRAGWQSGS